MNKQAMESVEFNKVLKQLSDYAVSDEAKQRALNVTPLTDEVKINRKLNETTEACTIIEKSASIPVSSLKGVLQMITLVDKGYLPSPEQFEFLREFLDSVKKIKRFMLKQEYNAPTISSYAYSLHELDELTEEITRCIRNNSIDDYASRFLTKTRNKLGTIEEKIKTKLTQIMKSSSSYLQDAVITVRNGRYAVSIKSEFKRKFPGTIVDTSSSGQTVYMEPNELNRLQDELAYLKVEEELEMQRILGYLTDLTATYTKELQINVEGMVSYDFIFAKAKLSKFMKATEVIVNKYEGFDIKNAKHPLLGHSAVPLTMTLGTDYRALVITGPNTGGKTVTIKTVGLLAMMVQSGLHIPASKDSVFTIVHDIFVDIGDHQSIEHSLSTFSSHIQNVVSILKQSRKNTLVILDEIGSGTDPNEGMGLAIAILEALYNSEALIIATTHYSEIKEFAERAPGFENGSMDFDVNTLQPLYKLLIGKGGESQAFSIAEKLGMPEQIISRAKRISYGSPRSKQEIGITPELTLKEKTQQTKEKQKESSSVSPFKVGDAVWIPHLRSKGIVEAGVNSIGELLLIIKGEKIKLNHKRVKSFIDRGELYPEEYDFDQVFDAKDVRKKKKMMNKKHIDGLTIEYGVEE